MMKNILLSGLVLSALLIISFNTILPDDNNEFVKAEKTYDFIKPFVVLELFTSQGCSSCPPADVLLEKTQRENPKNVVALSYHVDYWNYIGWTDPYSNSQFGLKQRKYNNKFKNRSNYTPQVVVNGREHFVGSDTKKMNTLVKRYLEEEYDCAVKLDVVRRKDDQVLFRYRTNGELSQKRLRAVIALDKRVTEVTRGENKRRTLSNSNIVIAEKYFELNESIGEGQLEIPEIVRPDEIVHLVLLLENDVYDILGAAKVEVIY